MDSSKNKFLITIILLLMCNLNIYSLEIEMFIGTWRCRSTRNPNDDAFIAISKISENELFVLYTDPFWEHRYDYASFGILTDNGYIHISTEEFDYYIEFSRTGDLIHYIRSFDDPHPSRFEKITSRESTVSNDNSLEDFLEFMRFLNQGR